MKKIDENEFQKKLQSSNSEISLFIANLYVDEEIEDLIGKDTEDHLLIVDDLANQIAYYALGLLTTQEFKDNIAEVLYLEGSVEIQKAYDAINKFVLSKLHKEGQLNEKNPEEPKLAEKIESDHISHHDILSEIENPTPSLDTTTDFQNASSVTNIVNTTSTGNVTQPTTSANPVKPSNTTNSNIPSTPTSPSLHSPTPTAPYTNPALHIATKLGQNLSIPSASIPKDIYVSKKPDPYHEPVQ